MKKWLWAILIVVVLFGCSRFFRLEQDEMMTVEGTVLQVYDNSVLISQRKDLSSDDLVKSYDEWMAGDYNLLSVAQVSNVEVGMVLEIILDGAIAESYPGQARAKSYEIISQIEVPKEDEVVIAPQPTYSEDLLNIFPRTVGINQLYNGYAEYGHLQTLRTAQVDGGIFELIFDGEMMDGIGDGSQRTFQLTYEITDQSVIEQINNEDCYNMLQDDLLLNSIIPNKVILKLPLEVGNAWIETFPYKGMDYTAKTEIIRIEENKDGKLEYETLTTVSGIEGYYNELYKETRVFTTGSGMTSFSNLFSLEAVNMDNEAVEQSEDLYIFGYSLSSDKVVLQD